MKNTAYLVLENGEIFEGTSFGAPPNDQPSEIVFTTATTGYLETLTDKCFYGQTVVQTFPLIGNYGVISDHFEGKQVYMQGYIVKDLCELPFHPCSEKSLNTFLAEQNIPCLSGIDTRALTQMFLEQGTMNGIITTDPQSVDFEALKAYRVQNAVANTSVSKADFIPVEDKQYRAVLWDFGAKAGIQQELLRSNCDVCVMPYNATASDILALNPHGILLSNGPGNPTDNPEIIQQIEQLLHFRIPIFGIGLGHQLLALAHGLKIEKMKFGHRGSNHPIRDVDTGRVYITGQNHGYTVANESIDPDIAESWYVNVNDGTCEGLVYRDTPSCSVQFSPEGCSGPQDTNFLFYRFTRMMEVYKNATQR